LRFSFKVERKLQIYIGTVAIEKLEQQEFKASRCGRKQQ